MICIQQWRAVIGCFCRKPPTRKGKINILNVSLGSFVNMKVTLLFTLCIVLCGDVETNPGPHNNYQGILDELRIMRQENESNFKDLHQNISSLKSDLSALSKKVDQNSRDIDYVYDQHYGEIQSLRTTVSKLEKKLEDQERYSRRDNVIVYNIPHDTGETTTATRDKLVKVLNENTDKTWASSDFVRVHRLKSKQPDKQPIIARLVNTDDKFRILNSRQNLKDVGLGVSNDLTPNQRSELSRLKQEGKRGYFKNGQLHIDTNYQSTPATNTSDQPTNHSSQDSPQNSQRSREIPATSQNSDFPSRYTRRGGRGANSSRGGYNR